MIKIIPNPDYISAPYELSFIDKYGIGIKTNDMTFRFREYDLDKACWLLKDENWKALKELSICPTTQEPFQDK